MIGRRFPILIWCDEEHGSSSNATQLGHNDTWSQSVLETIFAEYGIKGSVAEWQRVHVSNNNIMTLPRGRQQSARV